MFLGVTGGKDKPTIDHMIICKSKGVLELMLLKSSLDELAEGERVEMRVEYLVVISWKKEGSILSTSD